MRFLLCFAFFIFGFLFDCRVQIQLGTLAVAASEDLVTYESNWDANHPKAMSESWTWMGHLRVLEKNSNEGVAFIHYYTRNKSKMGNLTFKTSALTPTRNHIGTDYQKQTLYSSLAKDFYLKANIKKLSLEWNYQSKKDFVREVPFDLVDDSKILEEQLLPLFPDLQKDPHMKPIKSILSADMGSGSHFDLTFYSIWQPRAPTSGGRIRFLGVDGTFTFFHPMIIAIGTWNDHGRIKPVAGLVTLDRQWSNEYFGKTIFEDPIDYIKANRALSYSHNWSFFHGHMPESKTWIFVHLWNQFYRRSDQSDQYTTYSNLVWAKNGVLQEPLTLKDYSWQGKNFILNQSDVLLNYGAGREGYFPSLFSLNAPIKKTELTLKASPQLQSLDQPIYLYEAYAQGVGLWNGEPAVLQGRVESSRLLFRDQDYEEIIGNIVSLPYFDSEQIQLKMHLEDLLKANEPCRNLFCHDRFKKEQKKKEDYLKFISNDMKLKISIIRRKMNKKEESTDPRDPDILVYH
jgi:hypothetical protein